MRLLRIRMAVRTVIAMAACLLVGTASDAEGQARELTWPLIRVDARLDADGRLHVRERQTMRFTGDWNGGERNFRTAFGQRLLFDSLTRIDDQNGRPMPMVEGDLDVVDGYDWTDGSTLRWRSRLPSDPPFDGRELTYELTYRYENILQPQGEGEYLLDHDFAFAQREGVISRFELQIDIDSAWRAPAEFTGRYETTNLPPGEGFVVTVPLTRVAASPPAGVRFGTPTWIRQAMLGGLVAAAIALLVALFRREARMGRTGELDGPDPMTPKWLQENVLDHLPETIGAEWDNDTSSAEVAAILARLVQQGHLSSRVEEKGSWIFKSQVLHLSLIGSRSRFGGYERALIDALFDPGSETTDTERVRERYKKTGFDPAAIIRPGLTKQVDVMSRAKGETPSRKPTMALVAAAIALLAIGIVAHPADGAIAAAVVAASLPLYLIAIAFASAWRNKLSNLEKSALGFVIPLVIMIGGFGALLLSGRFRLGFFVLAGLAVWVVALANSIFNMARTRQSPGRIARRKRLAAAREWFASELAKPQPALRDQWFPYALAFGLGRHLDRWFDAFGGESAATASRSMTHSSGGGVATGGMGAGSWTGFGGGGGFGGAGGGASFASAIGGMAASVPAPSSSSSGGGGGGGGGSSGGGGGGGW